MAVVPISAAQRLASDGAPQTFSYYTDQFFTDVYFRYAPTAATSAGLHDYDALLEDRSAASTQRHITALRNCESRIDAIDPGALDAAVADDRNILLANIRSELLTLEVIRPWEKNPDSYSSGITNAAFVLMNRKFASPNTRLRALVQRERLMPGFLMEARKNLKNPPRIATEIALEQLDGIIDFFTSDVPGAFAGADDATAKADFAKSNAAVIQALRDYKAWIKTDLILRSEGDFRLGSDIFRRKLFYDEMVDTPLDRLLEIAYADLHKNQADFARVAKDVDPTKTPQQVLALLASVHPAPDKLLTAFQDQFAGLIAFIRSNNIITIPSDTRPKLEETPPFMRATTQASMDSPGPFETRSTSAYFNVTLPEKDWAPEHVEEHMAGFNVGTITSTAIHEAYPGHFVQYLWQKQFPSKIRKLLGARTNIEGWAHYTEQMMLDQGYMNAPDTRASGMRPAFLVPGAPIPPAPPVDQAQLRQARLIRLGQLQDALLRDARFVVSIRMHTGVGGAMSIEEANDFFVKEGYQSPAIGLMEAKRGTSDPTYLYYTLGKLQIMKLRADLMQKQGAGFNLQAFHDSFMRQGFAPLKIIRKAMLHDNSPTL